MGWARTSKRGWTLSDGRVLAFVFALFALILQANAPIQATLMAVGSDLPGDLCSIHSPGQNGGQDQRAPTDREKSCAACSVCVAGASTAVMAMAAVLPPPASAPFAQPSPLAAYEPQGPPARPANARAPPLTA